MSQLKLIQETTTSVFNLKVYSGYGYKVEVRKWLKIDDETIITIVPEHNALFQPEIIVSDNLNIKLSFDHCLYIDIKDADHIIEAINNVKALSEELKNIISKP